MHYWNGIYFIVLLQFYDWGLPWWASVSREPERELLPGGGGGLYQDRHGVQRHTPTQAGLSLGSEPRSVKFDFI